MSTKALSLIAALFIGTGLFAADEKGNRSFNPLIDTWMEGTIVSLDADGKTFSVRGWKLPYASAHCEMMQEIHNKTKDLQGADKQAKEQEIRNAWQDRLAEAKTEKKDRGEPSDFSFGLPTDGKLTVMEGRHTKGMDWLYTDRTAFGNQKGNEEPTPVTAENRDANRDLPAGTDKNEARAMLTLKDLKIGDRVKVGYDSGVITNTGYVVVKSDKNDGANTGDKKTR